jgi:hypothetical protein
MGIAGFAQTHVFDFLPPKDIQRHIQRHPKTTTLEGTIRRALQKNRLNLNICNPGWGVWLAVDDQAMILEKGHLSRSQLISSPSNPRGSSTVYNQK